MRSIGPFVAERFLVIVKLRNRLARALGYEDFYDYKVRGRGWGWGGGQACLPAGLQQV